MDFVPFLEAFLVIILFFLPQSGGFYFIVRVPFLNQFFNRPSDFGRKFRGKRIFGANKTLRAFPAYFFGALFGMLIIRPLVYYIPSSPNSYLFLLARQNIWLVSFLFMLGTQAGELLNSFLKRQLDIKPGRGQTIVQFIFDQIDVFLGMALFFSFVHVPPRGFIWAGIFELLFLHALFTFVTRRILKIRT